MILLDTCVVSEALKPSPEPRVLQWLGSLNEDEVFLPSLVLGELRKGIDLMPAGNRRSALLLWLVQLQERFRARTLAFDAETAARWGELQAAQLQSGTPVPVIDSLLAATALKHGAVLATRNTVDFERTGVAVFDPWGESSSTEN